MPIVNATMSRKNLNFGKGLDPELAFGQRWLVMAS